TPCTTPLPPARRLGRGRSGAVPVPPTAEGSERAPPQATGSSSGGPRQGGLLEPVVGPLGPARVAAVEFDDVVSGSAQRGGGQGAAGTALAVAHDGAAGRQRVEVPQDPSRAELPGSGDVSLGVFTLVAYVQDK